MACHELSRHILKTKRGGLGKYDLAVLISGEMDSDTMYSAAALIETARVKVKGMLSLLLVLHSDGGDLDETLSFLKTLKKEKIPFDCLIIKAVSAASVVAASSVKLFGVPGFFIGVHSWEVTLVPLNKAQLQEVYEKINNSIDQDLRQVLNMASHPFLSKRILEATESEVERLNSDTIMREDGLELVVEFSATL